MKKLIKKWGDSLVIVFNKDEKLIGAIEEGGIIDIKDYIIFPKKVLPQPLEPSEELFKIKDEVPKE